MKITYCYRWDRHSKLTRDYWDESRARKAHEEGKLYTVLVGDPQRPDCFLELNFGNWVGVEFLDASLRCHRTFSFSQVDDRSRLFLERATFRRFEGETDLVAAGVSYTFEPGGAVHRIYEDFPTTKLPRAEPRGFGDVSCNWEAYPQFGHYEGFVNKDRIGKAMLGEDWEWITKEASMLERRT